MVIKAIIFDCFGVLVINRRTAMFQDYPQLQKEFHDIDLQDNYGYISRDEYNQAIGMLIGLTAHEVEEKYWDGATRNEIAIDFARQLHSGGQYKVGLLSNVGRGWLDDFFKPAERHGIFDAEVLSGEVGMIKPAREIYELTAERLGVLPSECVMVDDVVENIDGAERAGMAGIVFVSIDQLKSDLSALLGQDNARTA